jgi:hypothetical protein
MYEELIEGVTPEIVDKELILDGTNSNYRILRQRYLADGLVIDEVFKYKYNTKSNAWGEIAEHYFEEGKIEIPETFRDWKISNHPTRTDIERRVYLLGLVVTTFEVRVTLLVRHFYDSGFKADIADKIHSRVGDDKITYEYKGEMLNERQYWGALTEAGYTPFQLLDGRIMEMDQAGVFNNY